VTVPASIDTSGLTKISGSLQKAVTGGLQRDMVESLHESARPIVADMQGAAFTKIQRRAAGKVNSSNDAKGITLRDGGDVLFPGAEYGGRKSKRVTYVTRSPLGRPYIVRRRTTMQFLPWLGREGYFFWPTVRDWMPKLEKQQEEIVEKVLG
jgi:hypothetical protein